MLRDVLGLPISTTAPAAAAAFDGAVTSYVRYRTDAAKRLAAALEADPEFGLAWCLRGYFTMLAFKSALVPAAVEALAGARRFTAAATPRERAHVEALARWAASDLTGAVAIWDQILADHPRDILAFRLAHFVNFWLGRTGAMRASVESVLPAWHAEVPGYAALLACHCFALEECGEYVRAEQSGRAAIALDPTDLWAAHGVAHVMEMQGRRAEGVRWIAGLEDGWTEANNLKHHLWWHCGLFHLECGEFDAVLDLYDHRFRDLGAKLVQSQPDLYIDVQNAASMLFRLERLGVDVGDRWVELADKAEARIGDCLSVFTLPHWMMALAATGRSEAAERMIAATREAARGNDDHARLVADVAVPVAEAVLLHRRGASAEAVGKLRPVVGMMSRIGGSHAQQDVLEQLYLDAALADDLDDDVRLVLERAAARGTTPLVRRAGYAGPARRFGF